ncbi:MAG: histidine kinase dimerization/phospho-acceptor domain-containing protein [Opitutales bacterium]
MLLAILAINLRALAVTVRAAKEYDALVLESELHVNAGSSARRLYWNSNLIVRKINRGALEFDDYSAELDDMLSQIVSRLEYLNASDLSTPTEKAIIERLLADRIPLSEDATRDLLLEKTQSDDRTDGALSSLNRPRVLHDLTRLLKSYQRSAVPYTEAAARNLELVRSSSLKQCIGSALVGLLLLVYYVRERLKAERTLRESLARSESANAEKRQFLANMSHETRTPLNGILGMAQLIEMEDLTDESRVQLEGLQRSGEALLGVFADIIDYTDIESPGFELSVDDIDTRRFFCGLEDSLGTRVNEAGGSLDMVLVDRLPKTVCGDADRMTSILSHLIDRVVALAENGQIELHVDWNPRGTDSSANLLMQVLYVGSAIPEETWARALEAFVPDGGSERIDEAYADIGLSISRSLVRRMDGELKVSDDQEGRAAINLSIPMVEKSIVEHREVEVSV